MFYSILSPIIQFSCIQSNVANLNSNLFNKIKLNDIGVNITKSWSLANSEDTISLIHVGLAVGINLFSCPNIPCVISLGNQVHRIIYTYIYHVIYIMSQHIAGPYYYYVVFAF